MSALIESTLGRDVAEQFCRAAVGLYPIGACNTFKLLSDSENHTYMIKVDGERYVVRVHRPGYHTQQEIQSELDWMDALSESGIQVPVPRKGVNGLALQKVSLGGDLGDRFVVLFEWIDGQEPDGEHLLSNFERLGAITASLHNHSKSWVKPSSFKRMVWDHETMVGINSHWGNWREAPYLSVEGVRVISEAMASVRHSMEAYGKSESRYGLIHSDLRLANLLLQGDETKLIDFDDCGFSWYMHDLASAVSFVEDHKDLPIWIEKWIAGYSKVGSLTQEDLAIIPALVMQRRIQLLSWFSSHADTMLAEQLGEAWIKSTVSLAIDYLSGRYLRSL
ncbi:phosphotransferase enzyme family protein [Pseudomonas aeruginosa]|uniref:phosphotransferase enzyme family protein n=1 Tax=Pseudomonas aeruginosa TaxID=287 RepID=UPI000F54B157|nr:phosphotransferase [Pseudomonas aeruginosa]MCS7970491.1 phosphotransferase [Pseudomonas aeruginosa]MCS8138623.1 phosphotransferase [Pseudomonas aeruginosa]MCS8181014.1 phosphotransferase [Pseudomonas aeruginosa]MCS8193661.1 phosphotransferase [Pseudomonas aeruginosa]MCT0923072.1 phosphotransferase [Pseudomonas aeruginosa]